MTTAISKIIDAFGGVRPFARAIGKSPSTVQYWIERGGIPGNARDTVMQASEDLGVGLGARGNHQSCADTNS
jgi:hypothetical protein